MKKPTTDIVLYRSKDGEINLDVQVEEDTVWLDAHKMAELFGRDRSVILRHINNIYKNGRTTEKNQPVQKLHKLPLMAKSEKWTFLISTP